MSESEVPASRMPSPMVGEPPDGRGARATRLAVIVPSFRRPEMLARCLASLETQSRQPDMVVVGARRSDAETLQVIADARARGVSIASGVTESPGVVAAMQAALDAAPADLSIIALLDDDATAAPDYCARIEHAFAQDPTIGGFGGRDWQPWERGTAEPVGRIQWFGRVIGNHHLGAGPAREVDLLKGVCSAYRAGPLREIGFGRLRGTGSQWGWELRVGLAMQARGWRLVYDPALRVEHHIAPRQVEDRYHRGFFDAAELHDAAANETAILLEFLPPWRRIAFLSWAFLVGTRHLPGLLQLPRLALTGAGLRWREFRAAMRGRVDGMRG